MLVLITGASGYIGRALMASLMRNGKVSVRAATRDANIYFPQGVERVVIASNDYLDWAAALRGVDVVVHLAGRAHVLTEKKGIDPLDEFKRANVDLTRVLANQASSEGVRRLVFVSSIGVNGAETHGKPFRADDPPRPATPYAQSKHEAELMLRAWEKHTSVELVIVRPPLVIGPQAPGNFKLLTRLLKTGIPLPLASVRNMRSFVGLDNLIDFLDVCLTHPSAAGETFLLSDDHAVSTPELLRLMAAAMHGNTTLFPFPVALLSILFKISGRCDTFRSLCSSLEIDMRPTVDKLGWIPPVPAEEVIRRACCEH